MKKKGFDFLSFCFRMQVRILEELFFSLICIVDLYSCGHTLGRFLNNLFYLLFVTPLGTLRYQSVEFLDSPAQSQDLSLN